MTFTYISSWKDTERLFSVCIYSAVFPFKFGYKVFDFEGLDLSEMLYGIKACTKKLIMVGNNHRCWNLSIPFLKCLEKSFHSLAHIMKQHPKKLLKIFWKLALVRKYSQEVVWMELYTSETGRAKLCTCGQNVPAGCRAKSRSWHCYLAHIDPAKGKYWYN